MPHAVRKYKVELKIHTRTEFECVSRGEIPLKMV